MHGNHLVKSISNGNINHYIFFVMSWNKKLHRTALIQRVNAKKIKEGIVLPKC